MQDLKGKTAVVTGAASGIGLAIATRLAAEGMQLVVADIKPDELESAADEIEGVDVLVLPVDVADADAVARLADAAYERFGSVDVLCPNAGVLGPPAVKAWEAMPEDWHRVYGANVFGVVNTIGAFVPRMLEADREGHIVVTASIRSLMVGPGAPPYMSSKHAVLAITEVLRMQLDQIGSKIHVSALCPGPVRTQEFLNEVAYAKSQGRELQLPEDLIKRAQAGGFSPMDPNEVADKVVAGIRANLAYIFTHANSKAGVMEWLDPIIRALDEQVG